MSRTQALPRAGGLAAAVAFIALALMALMAFASAPKAEAAFTTGKCAGPDITGRGASFARDAHTSFNFNFKNNYCTGTPGAGTINVTYEALGSGAGRTAVKVRDGVARFGMTDEPPSQAEVAQMNAGTGSNPASSDTNPNDNGQIHVIPAAVGAVAPLVNFPDGCDVNTLPAAAKTDEQDRDNDSVDDDVIRVRFTKAQFEGIWARDPGFENWDDVFPTLTGTACTNVPIIRVVRFDESGTSFTFKDYLDTIDPAEGWLTTYAAGANGTREWPGAVYGQPSHCGATTNAPGSGDDATDGLTSGCSNGNGALVTKLNGTDGSVGYSDISTARNASPSLAITPEGNDNDTYWTQIPNGSDAFTEPTADSFGFRTDGLKGANCQATQFTNVPSSTFGDWAPTSGVNSPVGFGICTFTYGLVFDDNADVWGNTAAEEAKARTVKDYWDNILSDGAQAQLFSNDYAPLPADVLTTARTGMASVDWNKGGGGGGGDGTPPATPPATPPPGGGTPPPVVEPSNDFSLNRTKISPKKGTATVSVQLPAPGILEMLGTAKVKTNDRVATKKKTIKVGRVVLDANQAGTFLLTLKPKAKAMKVLREKGSLRTLLELTFTPDGGKPKTETTSVKLKLADKK